MPDAGVARWNQQGRVYLWRYKENRRGYPGWHLSADDPACASLLDLIHRMLEAEYSSQQTIRTHEPTREILDIANNRWGTAAWRSAARLILKHPKGKVEPGHWELRADESTVEIVAGQEMLTQLQKGVRDILEGKGDYAIGPVEREEEWITFWWSKTNFPLASA